MDQPSENPLQEYTHTNIDNQPEKETPPRRDHTDNKPEKETPPKRKHPGEYSCEIAFELAWTIAFWVEVGKTDRAACQGPTWTWSNYAKIYYLISTIFGFIGLVTSRPAILKNASPVITAIIFIYSALNSLLKLAGLPLMIGMIISFANIDDCSDLHGIILAQFIFIMIGLGSLALICCCTCVGVCIAKGEGSANAISGMVRSTSLRLFGINGHQQPKQASKERNSATQQPETVENQV